MLDFLELPERPGKPRNDGITHVMDRGIGLRQAQDLLETSADFIDLLKLGWGTGYITPNLADKIRFYQDFGISVYFGGTLFEIAVAQGKLNEFRKMLQDFGITHVEVSNGIIKLTIEEKKSYIRELAQDFVVLSEVGSKDKEETSDSYLWQKEIQADLDAGAWKVITEARESGTGGIYTSNGEIRYGLIDEIISQFNPSSIIFEAPQQTQQVWFIKKISHLVNLGNISTNDVIALETLRLGLRSDTMKNFKANN
jgi:phosphosulfolactate synthase